MSLDDVVTAAKRLLLGRSVSYTNVFNKESVASQHVLADLAKFCRANESCFSDDQRRHAVMEGRREVFLRIQHFTKLTNEEVWKLYGREDFRP